MTDDVEVRAGMDLRARRQDIVLHTADGIDLVGELALPESAAPIATLICLHPLPTAGGFMDSHVFRKAAARLPALADVAVLRFNTRGTSSPRGTSGGAFDDGIGERFDVEAAVAFSVERGLPGRWLLGWSFGTELAVQYGLGLDVLGAILLSPPLHRATPAELARWHGAAQRVVALIPEFDDYLRPEEAERRFAAVPEADVVPVEGGRHLWVGESQVRRVLNEIVARVNPAAFPLPTHVPASMLAR